MVTSTAKETIIQGGMGVAVSSWELARAVAKMGQIGVVSGTCIDTVMVRELQDGDPHDRVDVLKEYPDQEIVEEIIDTFYVEDGIDEDEPYRLLPMHRFEPTVKSQKILSVAAFCEVRMAQKGHDGQIGINLLAELKRYTLPCMYGAMLADVDKVLIGAGIPMEEARQLPKLARGETARLKLDVDTSNHEEADGPYHYELDPGDLFDEPPKLDVPDFYPIIASDVLAKILNHKLDSELITGWIIEGPVAGGHNAPPRSKEYDEEGNPVYDEKDVVNLDRVREMGYPFYLAGGFGSHEQYQVALDKGAEGIQVGSLFSLCKESGYPDELTESLVEQIHNDDISIRTDGSISPTGYPFKVVEMEGTNGIPEILQQRTRICDLGYLREPYLDEHGRVRGRCPSEPVDDFVRKGGDPEETEGRGCLCNGLFANIGLEQVQDSGRENKLFTGGDSLVDLPLGSASEPRFYAKDVVNYLLNGE
ncbi:MAG: nitronate monooxygenase [bacterium]